jgi:glycosyltransferase involved in cell wall biosynthesis
MTRKFKKISAIILTKNEEGIIRDCLESVGWVDEIIIVDDHSTDGTLKVIRDLGVRKIILAENESSFSDRRNLGAKKAQGQWLLYVDADERVTPMLREEIKAVVGKGDYAAYAIPRRNIRLTKELHYGGWWPDYVLRLIKKSQLKEWQGDLHEQPLINGQVGHLEEALVHFSHRGSFEHKLQNTINWSKIEAQKLYEANHPPMTIPRFLSAMGREFYKRMIKYQAFRDGTEGIVEAFYQVFSVFITYARLWEMQTKPDLHEKE